MAHPGFTKEINPNAVSLFMQYGYISYPHTIFKNTYKLAPGHILELDLKTQSLETTQYWNVYDYYNRPKLDISLPEAIVQTEKVLEESFALRMVADVPVGMFLSGGYDSTCVTALLQKNSNKKIRTFTIGVTDQGLDEARFARDVARRLGTDHTEFYCTINESLDIINELPLYYDEPFADTSAIPTILVSRQARKEVTVALSADAGDEIFAGYNRYEVVLKYAKKLQAVPANLRRVAAHLMQEVSSERIPVLRNRPNFHSRYDKIRNLISNPSPRDLLKSITMVFNDNEVGELMNVRGKQLTTPHLTSELAPEFYDDLSFMMAIDYQTYMVG